MDLLVDILTERFNRAELDVLVWHLWHLDLERVAASGALPLVAKDVVSWAERRGERPKLAAAVRNARPRDPRVLDLADEFLETPFRAPHGELQQIIFKHVPLLHPQQWFAQALETATKVCAITCEISDIEERVGSGFLIAKDLVLTAYHNIDGIKDPTRIHVQFDHTRTRDGKPAAEGVAYGVAPHPWVVSSRPGSPLDETPRGNEVPADRELDFAVIRLDQPAGEHSVGARMLIDGVPKRGWIDTTIKPGAIKAESPLLIYHYPKGESMRLSVDMRSVVAVNANGTRLRHLTNTKGGSSGAPCFDASWKLIAIHQSAQWSEGAQHNQAVPIEPIAAAMGEDHVMAGAA